MLDWEIWMPTDHCSSELAYLSLSTIDQSLHYEDTSRLSRRILLVIIYLLVIMNCGYCISIMDVKCMYVIGNIAKRCCITIE